jgi:hypothetical protein
MGFDCGFDIYPPLKATASSKEIYSQFLDEIENTYQNVVDKKGRRTDGKILITESEELDNLYIWFIIGECPHIPANHDHCDYFLRFSSKVSGHLTMPAQPYIEGVYEIAKKHFGSRVHFWHELNEFGDIHHQCGYYSWEEVNSADKKLRELNTELVQTNAKE